MTYQPDIGDLVFTFQPADSGRDSWNILITEEPVSRDVGGEGWFVNGGVVNGILIQNCPRSTCIDIPTDTCKWARIIFRRGVPIAWGGNPDLLRVHVPNLPGW